MPYQYRRSHWLFGLMVLATLTPPQAGAQSDDDRYNIIRPESGTKNPEPWLPPKYQSPRGPRERVAIPPSQPVPQPRAQVPPPIYVPETGRLLPNLPALSGAGRGGTETSQDRALRCAHQAGVYGDAAGNRAAYTGSCINQ